MKVIIDTNLWISFLIGHQTQLMRRMLTDMRFDVYVCARVYAIKQFLTEFAGAKFGGMKK